MSRLIQISQVSTSAIADKVRACLRPDLDAERIGEFLSAVDWSDMGQADSTVLRWLGELEALSTAFAEADMTRDEYIARLQDYVNPVARAV